MSWGNLRYKVDSYYYIEINFSNHDLYFNTSFINFEIFKQLTPETKHQYKSHINTLKNYIEDPLFDIEFERYKRSHK